MSIASEITDLKISFSANKQTAIKDHFIEQGFIGDSCASIKDFLINEGYELNSVGSHISVVKISIDVFTGYNCSILLALGKFLVAGSFVRILHEGGDFTFIVFDGKSSIPFGYIPNHSNSPKEIENERNELINRSELIFTALEDHKSQKLENIHYWRKAVLGLARSVSYIASDLGHLKSLKKNSALTLSLACGKGIGYLNGEGFSLNKSDILDFEVEKEKLISKLTELQRVIDSVERK